MKLNLPKGYKPPEGARPGEPFEVVAVLSAEEDGTFKIKTLDGVELDEEEDEQEGEPQMENPFDALDDGALALPQTANY